MTRTTVAGAGRNRRGWCRGAVPPLTARPPVSADGGAGPAAPGAHARLPPLQDTASDGTRIALPQGHVLCPVLCRRRAAGEHTPVYACRTPPGHRHRPRHPVARAKALTGPTAGRFLVSRERAPAPCRAPAMLTRFMSPAEAATASLCGTSASGKAAERVSTVRAAGSPSPRATGGLLPVHEVASRHVVHTVAWSDRSWGAAVRPGAAGPQVEAALGGPARRPRSPAPGRVHGTRPRPGVGDAARLGQPVWTFRAERTADSRAPSIQAGLIEVWSPAKCRGPSEVGMSGNSSVCWPGKSTDASP